MFRTIQTVIITFALLCTFSSHAHAADIVFSPSSVTVSASGATVDVYINGNSTAVNAISGAISFPADQVSVASVSKSGSIIGMWAEEPSYSNTAGTVRFEGVILNPGFSGARGKVLSIRFVPKPGAVGAATIRVSSGSVLANDGNATNVTRSLGAATLTLAVQQAPTAQVSQPAAAGAPVIASSTHPDQDAWYSSAEPVFSWNLPTGVTAVRIAYGTKPDTIPTVVYAPAVKQKALADIGNGVYYFHAQFRTGASSWGPVSHYRFQVDTESPEPFDIGVDGTTLAFKAADALSGIDRYEVQVGTDAPVSVAAESADSYELPNRDPGTYPVFVRAIDRAGNGVTATAEVTFSAPIVAPVTQAPASAPLTFGALELLYVLLGALILTTLVTIWVALVRYRVLKNRIKQELTSIEGTLHEDFESIRDHFAVHSTAKTLTKTAIARMFKTSKANIDLIERDISHKIDVVKKTL